MSRLEGVFPIARSALRFDPYQGIMADAQMVIKRLGLAARLQERDRRPSLNVLDR
jgi:hypothetical protein